MEPNETLRKMRDMRLSGMADAYSEQMADRLFQGYMQYSLSGKHDVPRYISTSFVGPYSGY